MRWLPILFRNSNFPAETSFEEMMQARVPVSFHYADGWGMDAYHICCHLQDRHHSDLSKLVDRAETKNDVVYVIQSVAIRDKVNPLEYPPVPIRYKGKNCECSLLDVQLLSL